VSGSAAGTAPGADKRGLCMRSGYALRGALPFAAAGRQEVRGGCGTEYPRRLRVRGART
jgi:hypothetical protein